MVLAVQCIYALTTLLQQLPRKVLLCLAIPVPLLHKNMDWLRQGSRAQSNVVAKMLVSFLQKEL